ncbi:MAG TPA: serine/threonine-protein kinase, partial [Steroidobacteraceae bacterium]
MDTTEIRRRFEAYAAGQLTESELRAVVREAIGREPRLAAAYTALTSALQRGQVIPAELGSVIIADIQSLTPAVAVKHAPAAANDADKTRLSPRAPTGPADPVISARADEAMIPAEPIYADPDASSTTTGTRTGTGTGTGSAWDTPEKLAEPAIPLSVGSVLGRRFELLVVLGHGGMGVVYKALDRATAEMRDRNPYVAIKLLNDEFKRHPLAVRSLQREARKARKLAHPNIIKVYDFDRDGGNVYMVMELLSGNSLDQALKSQTGGCFERDQVVRMVRSLGAALGYAHEQEIVHADFKPSNAFMTDAGEIKVLDFGVARAAQSLANSGDKTVFDAAQLGALSPPYASLEMLTGGAPDPRDDIYALGCVTYELLAGHHPFNRIDAAKARDAGLEPARIKSLSREQWQALRGALAFEREARIESVAKFVALFCDRKAARRWWPIAAAAAVLIIVVAVAAAVVVPRQMAARQADALIAQLAGADAGKYSAALSQLEKSPNALKARVLADDAVRQSLVKHYGAAVAAAIARPEYDFVKARALLSELKHLLPDSEAVAQISTSLEDSARQTLHQELEARDRAISAGILIPEQGADSLTTVLEQLRRTAPDNAALTDSRTVAAFDSAARAALAAGNFQSAKTLLESGLSLVPTSPQLLDTQTIGNSQMQAAQNKQRAAAIETRLAALNPAAPGFLDQILAYRDDVATLSTLSPGNATVARLQGGLQSAALQRMRMQLKDGDIAGARDLLLNVGELLPEDVLARARADVLEKARAQESQQLDMLERLRRAVLTGRMSSGSGSGAPDLLAGLQHSGASPDLLAEARDLLAYGYLREARRARAAADHARAMAALAEARAAQPSSVWLKRIDNEQGLLDAAPAGRSDAQKNEIDAVRRQFADSLRTTVLGETELRVLAESLDRLEALGASAQELDAGLRNVEDRFIAQISRVQGQSGAEQAQLFARQASDALLSSQRIAEVARQMRNTAVGTTKPFAPDTLAQRSQLTKLIAAPQPTRAWAESLRGILQSLSAAMPADDPMLVEARRTAGATFAKAAAAARAGKHLEEAASLLALGRELDPDSAELARESTALSSQQSAIAQTAANQEQRTGIEVLKQRLIAQTDAGNMDAAKATANALRRVLAGSVYVSTELPNILIHGYTRLAVSQMYAGHTDAALRTLAAGRTKFGSAPELKNLEARYVTIADAYDRLSTAIVLNVAEQRRYLDTIKVSEGSDFHSVEQMLARTLA